MYRSVEQRTVTEDRFIAVSTPSKAEGVGRALQAAYGSAHELPAELRPVLERLNRMPL